MYIVKKGPTKYSEDKNMSSIGLVKLNTLDLVTCTLSHKYALVLQVCVKPQYAEVSTRDMCRKPFLFSPIHIIH